MNSFDSYMTPRDRAEAALACPLGGIGGKTPCNPLARYEETPTPEEENMCGCGMKGSASAFSLENCADSYPLAMVYSPAQRFEDLFDTPEEGLAHGTIFRSLCLPFTPEVCKGGLCRD